VVFPSVRSREGEPVRDEVELPFDVLRCEATSVLHEQASEFAGDDEVGRVGAPSWVQARRAVEPSYG
jgi:hypothetical protein